MANKEEEEQQQQQGQQKQQQEETEQDTAVSTLLRWHVLSSPHKDALGYFYFALDADVVLCAEQQSSEW